MSKNIVLDDIFDIEDYLDELEEKVPEIHSGTLRIEELSDINTRAARLVPDYQPTTSGISLQNLIDIKENTIDKDPTPTPEEDIVVKFFYANPYVIGIKKDFIPNEEFWDFIDGSLGVDDDLWNPKDDSISFSIAGHKFTGSDVCLWWDQSSNHYEIEVDPDAIEREDINTSIIRTSMCIEFPKGAFLDGDKQSKAVNYSFYFTDDLNDGDYPLRSQTIDTSDPTITHTIESYSQGGRTFILDKYTLPSDSLFNDEYWDTIWELIAEGVFTTIIYTKDGVTNNYTLSGGDPGDSASSSAWFLDNQNNEGYIEQTEDQSLGDYKGFTVNFIGEETFPA